MPLVIPNHGEADSLDMFVGKTSLGGFTLRLFQNNITPAETDTVSTYTEATFTGYSAIALTAASWATTEGAPTETAYAQQTFTSTAGSQSQNIYGYYLNRTTGNRIGVVERFADGPYQIVNNGDQIKVTPKITAD